MSDQLMLPHLDDVPYALEALALEIVQLTEAQILSKLAGKIVRKTVQSVSGNWVTFTDTLQAVRAKGSPMAPGDSVYLANVSDNPKRPAYIAFCAEELPGATVQVGESISFTLPYHPAAIITNSGSTSGTATNVWASGIPSITLPVGTYQVSIDTLINCSRSVGTGGFVFDQRLDALSDAQTFNNYAGFHYPARIYRIVPNVAGSATHELQIAWRGNGTAGESRIHDILQVVHAKRAA